MPADWVERSTSDHVATHEAFEGDRWGYLWWVSPPESALGRAVGHGVYKATGGRGHKLVVVPELDLVVVHRLATGGVGLASQLRRRFFGAPSVDDGEFNELMRRIVAAHPERRILRSVLPARRGSAAGPEREPARTWSRALGRRSG